MTLLRIENLTKEFVRYRSEWHRFAKWFGYAVEPEHKEKIFEDINIDIYPGESVGIIGKNGAGKSTLLKIIAGTMRPTEGAVKAEGRVSAILELGMGFDPELTGRQNATHATGLMGYSKEQIEKIIPDIEGFSEIGNYFDKPVRTYSSGMRMRVAFSVATAYRPEILIIDEALSVGDSYFQHKSFQRIKDYQELGTTLLIVSHDRSAIQTLCNRGILIDGGRVIKDGQPEEVFDYYNAMISEKEIESIQLIELENGRVQTRSGTGEAEIRKVSLHDSQGEIIEEAEVGEEVELRIRVSVNRSIESLVIGYGIKDRLGQIIYGTNTSFLNRVINNPEVGSEYQLSARFTVNIGVGHYSVAVALHGGEDHLDRNFEWKDYSLLFDVVNQGEGRFNGICWMDPTIDLGVVNENS